MDRHTGCGPEGLKHSNFCPQQVEAPPPSSQPLDVVVRVPAVFPSSVTEDFFIGSLIRQVW